MRGILIAAAAIAASQAGAQAGLSYLSVSYYNNYGVTVHAQGTTIGTAASAFSADLTSGAPLPSGHTDPFVAFCVDINNTLHSGLFQSCDFTDSGASASSGVVRQTDGLYRAADLYANYSSGIMSVAGDGSGYSWTDKQKGAALQLAIWEVLYETGSAYSVNYDSTRSASSQFYVTSVDSSVRSLANQMLAWEEGRSVNYALDSTFWNAVTVDQGRVVNRAGQDLLGPAVVPEPGTYLAGLLLVLPFLASMLRRKRQGLCGS